MGYATRCIERTCTVIADDCVQMGVSTGALNTSNVDGGGHPPPPADDQVTPAHDINDYAIAKRHALPFINILNKDASMNAYCGKYEGLDRCSFYMCFVYIACHTTHTTTAELYI